MDLEKIATSALVSSISQTDILSGFINNGDKEPCWDGNIYIYENSSHSKKNIKRIPTQVKGKGVKGKGSGLGDAAIVVTRYFGGTKLGVGGLVRAYGDAGKAVLELFVLRNTFRP